MPTRRRTDAQEPISFGRAYAQSDTFQLLFKDGMTLVEETAAYLDGEGRSSAKSLPRPASIVYATESMRLTTRLMQLASWLLLHRSVREGDMSPSQANEEKRKIRIEAFPSHIGGAAWDELPENFRGLVDRSRGAAEPDRADRRGVARHCPGSGDAQRGGQPAGGARRGVFRSRLARHRMARSA